MRFLPLSLFFLIFFIHVSNAGVKPAVGAVPMEQLGFKENKKQWNDRILFAVQLGGAEVYLERTGIYYVLFDRDDLSKMHPLPLTKTIHGHSYEVTFEGASAEAEIQKGGESPNYYNYFKGNNPEHWASHVHSYTSVYYKNIYPGIDVRFYFDNNLVKYEFIIHPGANASLIKMKYNGADGLSLHNGNVIVETSVGKTVEVAPVSYTSDHLSQTTDVKSKYNLNGNALTFNFPEGYDKTQELIIDPTLIFSTYTGSTSDNWGFTCTYDKGGNMYLGGLVNDFEYGGSFPATPGAFQQFYGGGVDNLIFPPQWVTVGVAIDSFGNGYGSDMSIAKINPGGTAFIYATYIGGSRNETPHSLIVNSQGELVIYGRTYSRDYPVTSNAFDQTYNGGADIALTVLSADGGSLVGSTYVGGSNNDGVNSFAQEVFGGFLKLNYGDDARGEVVVDANDNIYVASCTHSADFPVTPGCFQSTLRGFQNGCIFKMNRTVTTMLYATYVGGSQTDACYSLALKSTDGTVYATGGTMSPDFPSHAGGVNPNFIGGYSDGFLVHLSADGKKMLNSTFLGTNDTDQAYSVKLDVDENVYALGQTSGAYNVTAGVYSNPNSGLFISKLKPGLDSIFFSTVVGNGNHQSNLSPTAFLVDTCGNIYICGWGGDLFPGFQWPFHINDINGLPLTPDAYQSTTDGVDFYIMVLNRNAQKLLYATYFGGNGAIEHVDGGTSRFDPDGIIYEAICDGCGGNSLTPTTPGAISSTNNSPNCNELGFKIDLGQIAVRAAVLADPAATGCAPLTVNFINNSTNAIYYNWAFNTGNPKDTSSAFEPTFTFNDTGTFIIRLIASNPADCIPVDTAYTTVKIFTSKTLASYTMTKIDFCDSLQINFAATANGPFIHYFWNFGDSTTSTQQDPSHTYTHPGTYNTFLIVRNDSACNPLDTVYESFSFNSKIEAKLKDDSIVGCVPVTVVLKDYGVGPSHTYFWNFDDGTSSTDSTVTHTYVTPGKYIITLIVSSPSACNKVDSAHVLVDVYPNNVVAAFTASPTLVTHNQPVQFTNTSTGATFYSWDFGDGTTSNEVSPQHTYTNTGTFNACLFASNGGPCPSSFCRQEDIFFNPGVGVPNAFSPNGDGENDILYVKGQGIQSLDFRVFNRWGQLVFETTDLNIGWNGIFKGAPQDMDVYAWTLIATLDTNETVKESGNVTLLR